MSHLTAARNLLLMPLLVLCSCGYAHYAEPMRPLPEQASHMEVHDDGSVLFTQGRLEMQVRPWTEQELNRRFQSMSEAGSKSTNPYTFGDAELPEPETAGRFTVFYLSVKNYEYPKVEIDPEKIALFADNERQYWALGMKQLTTYFRAYALGYRGNEYSRYRERLDLLTRTMYHKEIIFSGQEVEGYLVFRNLHPDVSSLTLMIHDAVTRFDYRNEPVETVDVSYRFGREIGRVNRDGSRTQSSSVTRTVPHSGL